MSEGDTTPREQILRIVRDGPVSVADITEELRRDMPRPASGLERVVTRALNELVTSGSVRKTFTGLYWVPFDGEIAAAKVCDWNPGTRAAQPEGAEE